MSFTVTATQGGSPSASLALRIFVLTQAATTQNGASTNNQFLNATSFTQSITTAQTGSRVYGAASHGNVTNAAAALTTLVDNIADATNGENYTTFKATSLTGTPGATTLGFTCASASGPFAQLEVLTAGTLTEDASAPAVASGAGGATTAQTTATFTPPAGSLLVALVASSGGAGIVTMALSDTSGLSLTWAEKVKNNPTAGDYAGVWLAQIPGQAGSPTQQQRGGPTWKRKYRRRQTPTSLGPQPFEGWGQPL